jgi:hypothetical protein
MKRFFLILSGCILFFSFFSCVGFPKPQGANDSLVIGNLMLDFADGFFNMPKKVVKSDIMVNIANLTTNQRFTLLTMDGYFMFSTNGSDKYLIYSFEYKETQSDGSFQTVGPEKLTVNIPADAKKIIYLGHMTMTYNNRGEGNYKSGNGAFMTKSYDYKENLDVAWENQSASEYLQKKDSDGNRKDYTWENNLAVKPNDNK